MPPLPLPWHTPGICGFFFLSWWSIPHPRAPDRLHISYYYYYYYHYYFHLFIYIYIYFFLLGGSFWEQYWFRYNSKTRRFQNFFKRFVKVIERRIIHVKFTKQINNAFVNETEEKTLKLSVLLINSLIISGYLKTLWWLTATWMWLVDFDPLALWLAGGWKLKGIPNMLSFRVRLFSCTAKTVISSGNVPFYNYSRSPVYGHPLDMDTSLIRTVFMLPRVETLTFSLNSICF